jgi:uncharacterized membrane protein
MFSYFLQALKQEFNKNKETKQLFIFFCIFLLAIFISLPLAVILMATVILIKFLNNYFDAFSPVQKKEAIFDNLYNIVAAILLIILMSLK